MRSSVSAGARPAHVKDQGVDPGITILSDIGSDFLVGAEKSSSFAGNDLFFTVKQRTFERHVNISRISTRRLSKAAQRRQIPPDVLGFERNSWNAADRMPAIAQLSCAP